MSDEQIDDVEPQSLRELGLESFEIVSVRRSELKGAPYNPRQLGESEKRKLAKGLKRHGLVAPITWNARTGFVVGGHQRLTIMDSIVGKGDYTLNVARIDVDEAREKE